MTITEVFVSLEKIVLENKDNSFKVIDFTKHQDLNAPELIEEIKRNGFGDLIEKPWYHTSDATVTYSLHGLPDDDETRIVAELCPKDFKKCSNYIDNVVRIIKSAEPGKLNNFFSKNEVEELNDIVNGIRSGDEHTEITSIERLEKIVEYGFLVNGDIIENIKNACGYIKLTGYHRGPAEADGKKVYLGYKVCKDPKEIAEVKRRCIEILDNEMRDFEELLKTIKFQKRH